MKKTHLEIRVRYVETDQMGVAHHASYFSWMEAARTELMRGNGMSYRELEAKGFYLPVREAYCRYRKSLKYDDIMEIEATLLKIGGASIKIGYYIYLKGDNESVADGYTLHPFIDKTGKIVKIPPFFKKLFTSET
ncbi:MAG: acyl-CoA thioesterase [Spirochaetes bacterium]|nr:acyl-CoA thioesterase [Spirochaetota bacterium]MCK5570771.1 acyl-CoA thioesterase [Spirochaetota bacterium]